MITRFSKTSLVQLIRSGLENVPMVSFYAQTRGWPFVIAWLHRISGILMVLYIWFHIYTLSFLATPDAYDAQMKLFGSFPFSLLEWLLAALNTNSAGYAGYNIVSHAVAMAIMLPTTFMAGMTLPLFRSRWMTPTRWASESAATTCSTIGRASFGE